jgi:hypothetical protein
VRFVDLHSVKAEPVDELGRLNRIADQLTRIAARLAQLARQLGLSAAAERAMTPRWRQITSSGAG